MYAVGRRVAVVRESGYIGLVGIVVESDSSMTRLKVTPNVSEKFRVGEYVNFLTRKLAHADEEPEDLFR